MRAWWLTYPHVWAREERALRRLDPRYVVTDSGPRVRRVRRVRLTVQLPRTQGSPATLTITYPVAYPWFPPHVTGKDLTYLTHHRGPDGELCLLASDDLWSTSMTAAGLIRTQLPRLVRANSLDPARRSKALARLEARVPESRAGLLPYRPGAVILNNVTQWPAGSAGTVLGTVPRSRFGALMTIVAAFPSAARQARPPEESGSDAVARTVGLVRPAESDHDTSGSGGDDSSGSLLRGAWVRLTRMPPPSQDPRDTWARVSARLDERTRDALESSPGAVIVVVFPDEVAWRTTGEHLYALVRFDRIRRRVEPLDGEGGTAVRESDVAVAAGVSELVAPVADAPPASGAESSASKANAASAAAEVEALGSPESIRGPAGSGTASVWAVRISDATRRALHARTPETAALAAESVTVIGLGALGGAFAMELARAGLSTIHLVDRDVHHVENLSRQLPGLTWVEWPKAFAVREVIQDAALTTNVRGYHIDVGRHTTAQHETLMRLLAQCALVCDLTANLAVTRFLAAQCRAAGTRFLTASATNGAWGGNVTLLHTDVGDACWGCVELHRRDRALPVPPEMPLAASGAARASRRPPGCSEVAFAGAAFDLAAVWQHAARVAASALIAKRSGGLPHLPGRYFTLSQRDEVQRWIPATWQRSPLLIHPGCPRHPPTSTRAAASAGE